jgi:K(+)-stimulated pyrophosphate-energized sodium pump
MDYMVIAVISGILGLIFALFLVFSVLRGDEGSEKMREISAAIQEGATAFLGREYRILAVFVVVVGIVLGFIPGLGWLVSLSFVFGAVCSALAGWALASSASASFTSS